MIYFMQPVTGGPVKIGYSADVTARHRQLEAHYGQSLAVLATMPGDENREREIHDRFDHLRIDGPGVRGARIEQFRPDADLMAFIGRPLLAGANPDVVEAMKPKALVVTIRAGDDWVDWLDDLARLNGAPVTVTIEQSLRELAERLGHRKAPSRY